MLKGMDIISKTHEIMDEIKNLQVAVDLPKIMDIKAAMVHVVTQDGGYIHIAWKTGDDKVIWFEYIPNNWTQGAQGGLMVIDSVEEYKNAISDIDWIMDEENHITFRLP